MAVSYKSALCWVPRPAHWPHIQRLRCIHDRNFIRWPPHINLLYPFLEDQDHALDAAAQTMLEVSLFFCGTASAQAAPCASCFTLFQCRSVTTAAPVQRQGLLKCVFPLYRNPSSCLQTPDVVNSSAKGAAGFAQR